jgi:2-polyprenyl-3-methyl-5-hydroxy-6-metoxy-1,4-benzoquinol methylase
MAKEVIYRFKEQASCKMCGGGIDMQRILGKRLNGQQGFNPKKKTGITTTIVQCKNCSLIYSNPLPIPNSLQDHYGKPPETYWKEKYFEVAENYFAGQLYRLEQLLPFHEGMKSLDIGAGIGKAMITLSRKGFETYGIEPSEPFYERAIGKMGIQATHLQQCMLEDAHFENDFFDFITFGAVLEHLYDPSESILKALQWLKPGGILHMEIPNAHWFTNKVINLAYRFRGMDYVGNISPMHEPFHLYEFGLKSFQEHARINGYEIAHSEYYICETFLPKFLDPIIKPYMKRTNQGMQLAIWIRKR